MRKFQNFSASQTLREINFGDFRSAKSAILRILPHLEVLNFDFYAFLHFVKAEIYQSNSHGQELSYKFVSNFTNSCL